MRQPIQVIRSQKSLETLSHGLTGKGPQPLTWTEAMKSQIYQCQKLWLVQFRNLVTCSPETCFWFINLQKSVARCELNVTWQNQLAPDSGDGFSDPCQAAPRKGQNARFSDPPPIQCGYQQTQKRPAMAMQGGA